MTKSSVVKDNLTPLESKKLSVAERRRHNRDLALRLAEAGLYVFPETDEKIPLVSCWERADTSLSDDDREGARIKRAQDGKPEPKFFGSTRDPDTIRKMWREFSGAIPGISCGPSGLLVLDADAKHDGPAKLDAWQEENGGIDSRCAVTRSQSGGFHRYYKNNFELGCASGDFKRKLGTDVKGFGGQVAAPGAVCSNGKTYTGEPGTPNLLTAFADGALPDTPIEVAKLIKETARDVSGSSNVADLDVAREMRKLPAKFDLPDVMTDPDIGYFDLESWCAESPRFDRWWNDPPSIDGEVDHSACRFNVCCELWRLLGDGFSVDKWGAILQQYEHGGAFVDSAKLEPGEYNRRSIAREFLRAKRKQFSDGDALGEVDEECEQDTSIKDNFKLSGQLVTEWTPMRWTTRGLFPERGIALMIGDSHVGKTWLAIDWANRLDRGLPIGGIATKEVGVIYLGGEGGDGIVGRLRAWELHNESPGGRIRLEDDLDLFGDGTLNTSKEQRIAAKKFEALLERYERVAGKSVGVVFIDTLSSVSPSLNESDNGAVKFAYAIMRRLSQKHNLLFVVVHHSGLADKGRARGASAFKGNADVVILFGTDQMFGTRKVPGLSYRVDKQREADRLEPQRVRLRKGVKIGEAEDGSPEMSAVIEYVGLPEPSAAFGAVDPDMAGDEAPNLPEPTTGAMAEPERTLTRKEQERAERAARSEAKRHANSKDGRAETLLQAAAEIGGNGSHFLVDELRDRVNALRAASPFDLGNMSQSSFEATLAQLREAGRIVWASGQARLRRYRFQG